MDDSSMVESTVESTAGSAAAEPTATPEATEAPAASETPVSESTQPAESEPQYVATVGTADNPAHVVVDNSADLIAPLLVPLGFIVFALGIVGGCLLGKALNWWKW